MTEVERRDDCIERRSKLMGHVLHQSFLVFETLLLSFVFDCCCEISEDVHKRFFWLPFDKSCVNFEDSGLVRCNFNLSFYFSNLLIQKFIVNLVDNFLKSLKFLYILTRLASIKFCLKILHFLFQRFEFWIRVKFLKINTLNLNGIFTFF